MTSDVSMSSIRCEMARTTLDIDTPVLEEVKRLRDQEGVSLGQIVSRLLAEALASQLNEEPAVGFRWTARSMGARIDLADKDALHATLDDPERD